MNPLTPPIHPTTSTSTPEPATVDGSSTTRTSDRLTTRDAVAMLDQLNADREQSSYWQTRWADDHGDQHIATWLESLIDWLPATRDDTTESATDVRPVVSVVARVLAADQLADAIALGEESWFWPVGGEVADVGDVLRDLQATRAEACRFADEYAELRAELAATESDLAVAVREASAVRAALSRARPVVAALAGMRIGSLRDPHAADVLDLVDEALRNGGGR